MPLALYRRNTNLIAQQKKRQKRLAAGQGAPDPVDLPDYFVDSTRPDDSGDGTTLVTAKKTIAGVLSVASAGNTIALVTGSEWRESFVPTMSLDIVVEGNGAPPVLRQDEIVLGPWEKWDPTPFPNLWRTPWTRQMPIKGEDRHDLWVNGAHVRFANTLGDLELNGGWFMSDTLLTETEYVYVKSATDPATNGNVYEMTKRKNGFHWHGTAHEINITGPIEVRRALDHYNAVSGGPGIIRRMLLTDGGLHHFVIESELAEDILGRASNPKTIGPAPFTFFRSDGLTYAPVANRLGYFHGSASDRLDDGSSKAFYGHSSGATYDASLNGHTLTQCWSVGINFGGIVSRANGVVKGCYSKDPRNYGFDAYGPVQFDGCMLYDAPSVGGVYTAVQLRNVTAAQWGATDYCGYSRAGSVTGGLGATTAFTNCCFVNAEGIGIAGESTAIPAVNHCVIDVFNRVFNGVDSTTGDHNIFMAPSWNGDHPTCQFDGQGFTTWNTLQHIQTFTGSNANSVWTKNADQTSGNPLALWLGVANGTGGPEVGDYRINPNARVYTGNEGGTARIGTFLDGTPITNAGATRYWNWNTRAWVAGAPQRYPTVPDTLAEERIYIADPEAWDFYP